MVWLHSHVKRISFDEPIEERKEKKNKWNNDRANLILNEICLFVFWNPIILSFPLAILIKCYEIEQHVTYVWKRFKTSLWLIYLYSSHQRLTQSQRFDGIIFKNIHMIGIPPAKNVNTHHQSVVQNEFKQISFLVLVFEPEIAV